MRPGSTPLRRLFIAVLTLAVPVTLTACGSGARQDKNEPSGTWKVDVLSASFPGRQHLAQTSQLVIKVRNLEQKAIPDLAVTVDGFNIREEGREFEQPERPIWVVEDPPPNSTTAYTNTWAIGPVPGGQTRTLKWTVNAVRAGTYTLRWRVSAGLNGKAKARLPEDNSAPAGSFIARLTNKPRRPNID
jgi:hypothetical protein